MSNRKLLSLSVHQDTQSLTVTITLLQEMALCSLVNVYCLFQENLQIHIQDALKREATRSNETSVNTVLVKIMLTLLGYFSPAERRTPWVTD